MIAYMMNVKGMRKIRGMSQSKIVHRYTIDI